MKTLFQSVFAEPWSASNLSECSAELDNAFGPLINGCRFDFTLFFEQCVLSSVPALILLLVSPWRIHFLSKAKETTGKNPVRTFKLITAAGLIVFNLTLVAVWFRNTSSRTTASVPAALLNLLAAACILPLSYLESERSARPSTIIELYLLFSVVFDIPQLRTLYILGNSSTIAALYTTTVLFKFLLLLIEAQSKRPYLKPEYQNLSTEATSGIINRSFMWWLNELFTLGANGYISSQDLPELEEHMSSEYLGKRMVKIWQERKRPDGRLSFVIALWHCLLPQFALVFIPRLSLIGFTFAQPFLISTVMELLLKPDNEASRYEGYGLVLAAAAIYLGIAISGLYSNHNLFRFITAFRGATVSLIYNHAFLLQDDSYDRSAAVSLMSTDVDRIAFCLEELNECWSRLIEVAIGIPLLARQIGWISVMPMVIIALSTLGDSVVAAKIGGRQKAWADATQRRVTFTSTIIKEMKLVKMMGLTTRMSEMVQNERVIETKKMEAYTWMMVWLNVIANIPFVMAPAATFTVYAIQAHLRGSAPLNTVQALTSLALITLVSYPTSRLLSAIPNTAASIGCFDRIQDFLTAELRVDQRLSLPDGKITTGADTNAWNGQTSSSSSDSSPENTPILADESNYEIAVQLIGSTIRPAPGTDIILRNVQLTVNRGSTVMITGVVGSGKSTLLRTILGEVRCDEGTISVANRRMAYCSQTPWLPNGTVKEVICGFSEEEFDPEWYKTVVDACALRLDMSTLSRGDATLVGSRGIALSGGQKQRIALARTLYSRSQILILDDVFSALDKRTEGTISDKLLGKIGLFKKLGSTVILVTQATHLLHKADKVVILSGTDHPVQQGTFAELEHAGALNFASTDFFGSRDVQEDDQEELFEGELSELEVKEQERDLARKAGDIAIYRYYYSAIGLRRLVVFVLFVCLNVFSGSFSSIWLKWWADIGGHQILLFSTVYFLLAIGCSLGIGGYAWAIAVVIGPSTGRKLHQVLLRVVMSAPQSFFVATETGTILNRFSQDMSVIESQLSTGLLTTVSNLVATFAETALVATGSYFMALTIPFFMLAIYFLQRVYLQTSRQLRILDLETRSPVYSLFLETLEGLTTIRAFGAKQKFAQENARRLDGSQKPFYLMFCIERWLALVLDLMLMVMATTVVALATTLRFSTSPGLLGVSLNSILSFNQTLSAFIAGWTLFETSLGAIARLKNFEAETPVEAKDGENASPPATWPATGSIDFKDVSASYDLTTPVLRNISFTVSPGQKFGICGRTGSGKSTLLASLLRIVDHSDGHMTIDSVNIATIPRTVLRRRLISVPQDTLHLPGTVRLNADPLGVNSDSAIITALGKVGLWPILEARGGLDEDIQADALSKGQQQLFALARAMLQRQAQGTKVVLMDEATSSMDGETERVVRQTLRDEFQGCTVLCVAHRLETILDMDVVLVMDGGRAVEIGPPRELMAKEGGALRKMWQNHQSQSI